MSPLKHSNNLAARMGRWSAGHWKTAVFGWLALVVASVYIGGAVGTKYLEDTDLAVGEAGKAAQLVEAGFPAGRGRAGRDRPDPVQDPDGRRSRLQGDDRGRREDPRGEPEGPQARHAARRRSRRPRLGRRPLGAGAVPARRHLRRGRPLHRRDQRTRSTRPRPRTTASRSASSAASRPPRRPTRRSRACSRRPR